MSNAKEGADEAPRKSRPTTDDLVRFLVAEDINPECVVCKTNSWTFMDTNIGVRPIVLALSLASDEIESGKTLDVFMMSCNKCGYIWQIAMPVVRRWLASQQTDKSADASHAST